MFVFNLICSFPALSTAGVKNDLILKLRFYIFRRVLGPSSSRDSRDCHKGCRFHADMNAGFPEMKVVIFVDLLRHR